MSEPPEARAPEPTPSPTSPRPPPLSSAQAAALSAPERPKPPAREESTLSWAEPHAARPTMEGEFPLHGVAFHFQAQIYRTRDTAELPIGYLRRGAKFRARRVEGGRGCRRGFVELSSGGFVCHGEGVVVGETPQRFDPSPVGADRFSALPYRYAKNLGADAHQYFRVPQAEELATLPERLAAWDAVVADLVGETPGDAPEAEAGAADDGAAPELPPLPDPLRMRMDPGFYVSVDTGYAPATDAPEAGYLRSVRGAFLRDAGLAEVTEPVAPGRSLRGGDTLPIAFVFVKRARAYERRSDGTAHATDELSRLGSLPLWPGRTVVDGQPYLAARDGRLLREHHVRVAAARARPSQIRRGARWVHVSLSSQTLVAYEGERPVFATLVSSGKEGYETPTGLFRIHTKHVSTTMDGMDGTEEAYSIEDVPWTMYFNGSYALHAAFWHDRFGRVRSHGCVNLAPADARWLFEWTTPTVPAEWHGAVAPVDALGSYVLVEE